MQVHAALELGMSRFICACKLGQRERKRSHTVAHILRAGVLVRVVAQPSLAWDEDHGCGGDQAHEGCIVIGLAHHLGRADSQLLGRVPDS